MSDGEDDKRAGYRRPPLNGQFKKGQSGNPKGRPRKAKPLAAYHPAAEPTRNLWRELALRLVPVREGEKTVEIPMLEAVIKSMGVAAVKGGPMAQRTFIQTALAEDERYRAECRERFNLWSDYRRHWLSELESCRRRGEEPPELVPHPEDIELDYETFEVRFNGAIGDRSKARQDLTLALRDFALGMAFYYRELANPAQPPDHAGFFFLEHTIAQLMLPPRLRISGAEFERRFWRWFSMSDAEFLKELSRLAAAVEMPFTPKPRRKRRPYWAPLEAVGLRIVNGKPERISNWRPKTGLRLKVPVDD